MKADRKIEAVPGIVSDLKISQGKGKAKISLEKAQLFKGQGIDGDIHTGSTEREISFFTFEGTEKLKNEEINGLCTGKFWGNIITKGIDFSKLSPGTKLKIGDAIIEITEIGKTCYKDCELLKKGLKCTIPMETAFGKILEGGQVSIGDKIEIIKE